MRVCLVVICNLLYVHIAIIIGGHSYLNCGHVWDVCLV